MRLTKKALQEREQLIKENTQAKQQIDNRNRRIKEIETAAAEALGKDRELEKTGFRIAWETVFKGISWKSAFIKECGHEKANQLQLEREETKKLVISKIK